MSNYILIFADASEKEPSPATRVTRPRALTTSKKSFPDFGPQASAKSKHTRAISDLPGEVSRGVDINSAGSIPPDNQKASFFVPRRSDNSSALQSSASADSTKSSLASAMKRPPSGFDDVQKSSVEEEIVFQDFPSFTSSNSIPIRITDSLLNLNENRNVSFREDNQKSSSLAQEAVKECGTTFDALVDRLLSQPMSKSDDNFTAVFLCLYRKFAAPSELLAAVMQRFQLRSDSGLPQVSRVASQFRHLSVLAQWISNYPGDFAHAQTRLMMSNFVARLVCNRSFAVAAKEINAHLGTVSEDDDTEWGCSDKSRNVAGNVESFSGVSSVSSNASTLDADSSTEDVAGGSRSEDPSQKHGPRHSATASLSSSAGRSESQSTGSSQTLLNSVENAQRQAQLLMPIPRNALTKVQWHQLMDVPEDEVAKELTRIDWILFSSVRPRDLVRHVGLSGQDKEKCKSLEHVNRMIDQFNHVAFWVANMIVLRDKPKHRARMLERFMAIAWVR